MRYVRIFLITFAHVLEQRGRILIWFFISFINPLLLLLFWRGLAQGTGMHLPGWTVSTITSYYLLLTIGDSLLSCHIEEDISREDVGKGDLAIYLMKPLSYFWKKFLEELPYRIMQGFFACIVAILLIIIFGSFGVSHSWVTLLFASLSAVLGLFLSFTFKIVLGLLSLWITEVDGIYQFYVIINLVVGGFIVPLFLMPSFLSIISYILPFSYIVYFPVIAFQGKLSFSQGFFVLVGQIVWILIFTTLYKYLWKKGIKHFTAVGR